ncbi:cation-efflux pump [Candidatus Bathyarchaeota archaeon]|nr:cation-efflux pump [Candidatus Bathyarchaeota archaeon]
MQNSQEGAYKLNALKLSAIAIASVVVVEVSLGLIVNSLAILSDGLHALLDAITTLALFLATKAALKPPDEEHTYGHEKFETIGGLIGGIALIGIALLVIYEAISKLAQGVGVNEELKLVGFSAIGFTFCIDILRIVIFRKAAGSESTTVKVGFYHAIADLSSTVIAFLGFGLATLAQIKWGDSLASMILGILLGYLSIKLIRSNIMELSDTASKEMVQRIRKEILSHEGEGALKCENLKVRKVGSKTFIETTVQVPNRMNLEEAHALASKIEANLTEAFGNVDATIHIEPSEKETKMEQLVEKLATVEGVRAVHEIATVYSSGKLYITLHAYVDPKLSVEEAHEIAEKIENRMRAGIKQLENVTVHVEPYGAEVRAAEIDENELRKIIQKVAKDVERNVYIKRIVTYAAEGKRYINMDCCFTKQVSITEAHEIASRIEEEIKERFEDAVVTVHMEPDYA